MQKKIRRMCILYLLIVSTVISILVLLGIGTTKFNDEMSLDGDPCIDFPQKTPVIIPTTEDINELNDLYLTISTLLRNVDVCRDDFISHLRRKEDYTISKEILHNYEDKISEVQEYIALYEERYNEYIHALDTIPLYSSLNMEKYNEFMSNVKPLYQLVINAKENFFILSLFSYEDQISLEEFNNTIVNAIQDTEVIKEEFFEIYNKVTTAKVCSIANRYFNSLQDIFNTYEEKVSEIQNYIQLYELQYSTCIDFLEEIPAYSSVSIQECNSFLESYKSTYPLICEKKDSLFEVREELYSYYLDAKQIADDMFDEYYDLMCRIVYCEVGSPSYLSIERCWCANVIENRILDPDYPNTIYGVVYQPNQYEPVLSGSINRKKPSEQVKKDIENYLRGKIETGMPRNVVFQSMFKQGSGIWQITENGDEYFCFK